MCGLTICDFRLLLVSGRGGDQPLAEARAPGREQREPHPALEGRRWGRRSQVTEARLARSRA